MLRWSTSPSRHAYVVFPKYRYDPVPSPDAEPAWTTSEEWMALAGQQRELFYVDGENICYAGTFFCHAGPRVVKASDVMIAVEDA